MHITNDEMNSLPFQSFQKMALLQARPLTQTDYQQRGGIIQTREGPVGFRPGDYLARGVQSEEWPITQAHFLASYEQVSELGHRLLGTTRARMWVVGRACRPMAHRARFGSRRRGMSTADRTTATTRCGRSRPSTGTAMWCCSRAT